MSHVEIVDTEEIALLKLGGELETISN
jgi:hypothetical protein